MRLGQYLIVAVLSVIIISVGLFIFYTKQNDSIRNVNFEKDFKQIDTLFHRGDNWYWMISDYSRKVGYDLEHTIKYKSSSPYEKRFDLVIKVLELDNKVIGLAAYYPKSSYIWQFLFLLVDQDYRGRGFAKKLLKYAVDDMVKRGAIKVNLVTRLENARSQGLYQSFGFKKTQTTEEHVHMAWTKS